MKKEDLLNLAYITLVEYELKLKENKYNPKKERLINEIIYRTEELLKEKGIIQ